MFHCSLTQFQAAIANHGDDIYFMSVIISLAGIEALVTFQWIFFKIFTLVPRYFQAIGIREYIECSLAQPPGLVLVE
jgi:hypothetical protein